MPVCAAGLPCPRRTNAEPFWAPKFIISSWRAGSWDRGIQAANQALALTKPTQLGDEGS